MKCQKFFKLSRMVAWVYSATGIAFASQALEIRMPRSYEQAVANPLMLPAA